MLDLWLVKTGEPLPESVFVHGQPATGKTSLVCGYLERLDGLQLAYVNCIECYTPRLLLDRILGSLIPSDSGSEAPCDNFMDLVHRLRVARMQGLFNGRSQVLVIFCNY